MLKCGKCRKNVYVVFAQIISLVKLRLKKYCKAVCYCSINRKIKEGKTHG